MSYFYVFISCLATSIFILSFGILGNKFVFKIFRKDQIIESYILGIISLSIFALFANFFINLNIYFNSTVFLFSIILILKNNRIYILQILKFSLIISLISFITIILDNTNRPDAGLYHLPFIKLLNDFPIVIGSANLNERFGIISIIQYLSAINYNFITHENGILIPLVVIFSVIILFFFKQIFKKDNDVTLKILSFLFLVFILLNMNRYSGFGNDAPCQMFYFLLIFYFLTDNLRNIENKYKLIALFSLYTFLIKPFFILTSILILIIIINKYKEIKILNFFNLILIFIFFIWILKNILVSGCLIYPLEITCVNNFSWTLDNAKQFSLESEAWSKDWVNREDKSISYENYLNNYNWISIWIDNHFKIILEKISPFIFLIIVLSIIILSKNKLSYKKIDKRILQLLIFNLFFLLVWFFNFPLFRFGSGIIASTLSLLFLYLFYNRLSIENKFFYKSINFFLILLCLVIFNKNLDRILKNYGYIYTDYPWPKKNSSKKTNSKIEFKIIKKDNQFLYYKSMNDLCYYNPSPCTHKTLDKPIIKSKILNFYDKFEVDNQSQ